MLASAVNIWEKVPNVLGTLPSFRKNQYFEIFEIIMTKLWILSPRRNAKSALKFTLHSHRGYVNKPCFDLFWGPFWNISPDYVSASQRRR